MNGVVSKLISQWVWVLAFIPWPIWIRSLDVGKFCIAQHSLSPLILALAMGQNHLVGVIAHDTKPEAKYEQYMSNFWCRLDILPHKIYLSLQNFIYLSSISKTSKVLKAISSQLKIETCEHKLTIFRIYKYNIGQISILSAIRCSGCCHVKLCYQWYSLSNVIVADEKLISFHQYLR